jgi:hypothetical protein
MDEFKLNALIDEAITSLSSDGISTGAECLTELAHIWAKAGMPFNSFLDMRKHIINEAVARTSALFIAEKLKLAERESRNGRSSTTGIILTS